MVNVLKNSKLLVTGGAGFIGSHLIEKLLYDGNEVICIDDLSTGFKEFLPQNNNLVFINEKVQNIDFQVIPEGIKGIFHLAAQASVPISLDAFYSSSSNNLLSSLRVFELAKIYNVPLVYASSSAVYGNLPIGDDQKGKYDILSPYAQDKLTLEHYARMCWNIYGIPSAGLRFFNVYGPRQDPANPYSGVISIFIDRLMGNKPVTVNGGYQTRDFVFVEDIAKVMIESMKYLYINKSCDVFNIGTGISVTINHLLAMLANVIKIDPEIVVKELPHGDPEKSGGTYNKLKNILNIDIDQFVKLEKGLSSTINLIKKAKSNENL
jgi:UDP-glucose 4-epimerase